MPQPQTPERQYYFDRDYLKQYIDQKVKLKVFVDGRYLSVADMSDLEDELSGWGYDNSGSPRIFQYRDVEQIKAGSKLVTLDQLQQQQEPEQPEETPEEEPTKEPEGGEAPKAGGPIGEPGEEEPAPEGEETSPEEEEPEQELAWYDPYMIGRNLIQESHQQKNRKEINKMVRILERPYYNVTGIVTEVYEDKYEIRCLSKLVGRILVNKDKVKFL